MFYNKNMVLKNFIVFEGIDGSGTTTQIKLLEKSNSQRFFSTAEPTDLPTGRFLRKMLKGEFKADEKTNSYLFAADRCEHIYGKDGIISKINEGKTVISDRYLFSSLAYQASGGARDTAVLVNSTFPLPEYLFYFKINPEISLSRVEKRNGSKEIYETLEKQKKIAEEYEKVITQYENDKSCQMKIIRIDAAKSIDEISQEIQAILK